MTERCLMKNAERWGIVVIDNISYHKVKCVREIIEKTGTKLECIPLYNLDLNPIEKVYSKIKAILRKLKCRT